MKEVRSIICDVGHVICPFSIMNRLINKLSNLRCDIVLYDDDLLQGVDANVLEEWVSAVTKIKASRLIGTDTRLVKEALMDLPLTPGFSDFVLSAKRRGAKFALVGAVPKIVTEILLEINEIEVDEIFGTELHLEANRIVGVGKVVTPQAKKVLAESWLRKIACPSVESIVIGDSIGDLAMMKLVPRERRIAFNSDNMNVLALAGNSYSHSMVDMLVLLDQAA